ncbi:thiamine phosphate synthase [Faecalicatena contorta]|uniref:thiamine phosphate synthase n=1 Tax=Faecalicatena contorta TaxID=39482 RepID=UPI001F397FBF|nr:thiamine phosphate synthase [Faecalicatena contorta]MCF2683026.1 thiamine phosphate synthase [Faecalicatena contorta]
MEKTRYKKNDHDASDSNFDQTLFHRIIAVSNRHLCRRPFPEQIKRICQCHPQALILREKDLSADEYALLAEQVMRICRSHQVPCILHTYWKTALELHCTSIHLPLPLLREWNAQTEFPLSAFKQLGTSVHSIEEAVEAERLGATYITAGHIYATDCKKGLPPRGLDFLRKVCQAVDIPVYAIGGIKPDKTQFAEIQDCGAAGGCIMSAMMEL